MNVISQLFGRKTPNADALFKEIAAHNADKAKEQDRAEKAKATLANVAILTDAEHEAAESALAASTRAIARIEARIAQLQEAHATAQKDEALAALKARAEAARRRVEVDAPKLLDRYEALGAEIAQVVDDYTAINAEVDVVNAELRKAGLPSIDNADFLYRREPGEVIPERREKKKLWVRVDPATGVEQQVRTIEDRGRTIPTDALGSTFLSDAREVEREVVVSPAQRKPDRWLDGLSTGVSLPPARVGRTRHWPKG